MFSILHSVEWPLKVHRLCCIHCVTAAMLLFFSVNNSMPNNGRRITGAEPKWLCSASAVCLLRLCHHPETAAVVIGQGMQAAKRLSISEPLCGSRQLVIWQALESDARCRLSHTADGLLTTLPHSNSTDVPRLGWRFAFSL